MAHKHPSGVMVADVLEVFKPEELMSIFEDMAREDEAYVKELTDNPKILFRMLLEYSRGMENWTCDVLYVLEIVRIKEIHYSSGIKSTKLRVVMEVRAQLDGAFKRGTLIYSQYNDSGSWLEPPDYDEEAYFADCDDCKVFGQKRYVCYRCEVKKK